MGKLLPENWVETRLDCVVFAIKGKKPKRLEGFSFEDSLPYMDIKALEFGEKRQYADIKSSNIFENNDVAIVWDGARSGWVAKSDRGAIGSTIAALKPIGINSDYLYYYLLSQYPFINSSLRGVGIPHIDPTILWNLSFPLPPLPEQKRIADKLDTLFEQIKTIRKATDRIPQLLKKIRQQILTYAITGKLTEDWRKGKDLQDPGKIIQDIKRRRFKDNKGKEKEILKIQEIYSDNNSCIDFKFPEKWIAANLDKLCFAFSYGTSNKSDDSGKYSVIRMVNIQDGKIDWSDLKYTTDEKEYKKYFLQEGDVLFNRTNSPELVGKTAIFDGRQKSVYAGYLIKISNYIELSSKYLNFVLNSLYAKRWCRENKTDGVSQSNINAQKLSKFTIPFPGIQEQQEIVRIVEMLFDKLNIIELRYEVLKKKIDNLPQAILHKAFKGELVEQLPTDGDALDLLREIEQLRTTIKKR